jgi:hypothetical protein
VTDPVSSGRTSAFGIAAHYGALSPHQLRPHHALILNPDTELLEYVCAEAPRERFGLVGRSEAGKKVQVPVAILDKYVGDYDFEGENPFGIRSLSVTRTGDRLFVDFNGKGGRTPLVALSQNMFSPRLLGTYEFVTDAGGAVTHVMVHGVEFTQKAVRKRDSAARETPTQ